MEDQFKGKIIYSCSTQIMTCGTCGYSVHVNNTLTAVKQAMEEMKQQQSNHCIHEQPTAAEYFLTHKDLNWN